MTYGPMVPEAVRTATPGQRGTRSAVGSPTALRDANRDRILEQLRRAGTASQSELARATGLSRATVLNIVRELADRELVTLTEGQHGGRRTVDVSLNPKAGVVVGVDFGHTHLRIAVADLTHEVLAEDMWRLELGHNSDDDIRLVSESLERLLPLAGTTRDRVLGVGLGLPAPVDPQSGEVGSSSILPGWVGVPAAKAVGAALRLPVVVDNDANLGALAEMLWGAARGCEDLVYIKASTGIGAGLVMHGQVYRGAAGTAGEIGHMTIDEAGALCRCGNRGCLETVVGARALVGAMSYTRGDAVTVAEIVAAAEGGDPGAERVLADAGRAVADALAPLCTVLDPALVVIGGECSASRALIECAQERLASVVTPLRRNAVPVRPGALLDRAEMFGAVALVTRRMPLG